MRRKQRWQERKQKEKAETTKPKSTYSKQAVAEANYKLALQMGESWQNAETQTDHSEIFPAEKFEYREIIGYYFSATKFGNPLATSTLCRGRRTAKDVPER